ncbi:MAG: hypothetical protein H6656_21635 [Ardenticatenaceae bacterium]|nr:hypothetical protein [Ardenticatenaceae bacterium]
MLTNDLTKLTRWIVPGWLAILAFYAFTIIDVGFYVAGNTPPMYASMQEFLTTMTPFNGILEAIFLAAAGVPLGFSIYQVYFFLRWNSLFSRDGLLPPIIPGRMRELDQIQKDITDFELSLGVSWRNKWVSHPFFKADHGFRSRYHELLFLEAVREVDTDGAGSIGFHDRHLYLHEISHTLGASILAVYLGFIGYVLLKLKITGLPVADYLFIISIVVGMFFFLVNFEYNKKADALKQASDQGAEELGNSLIPTFHFRLPFMLPVFSSEPFTIKWEKREVSIISPAAQFVFILMLLHLWVNPSFSVAGKSLDGWTLFFRILLSLILIVSWYNSKKEHSSASKLGDTIVFGSSFLATIILARVNSFINWVDWSFFMALVLFLLANMVLFFNRQNSKEQSFDLQHYVLKQYLDKRKNSQKK